MSSTLTSRHPHFCSAPLKQDLLELAESLPEDFETWSGQEEPSFALFSSIFSRFLFFSKENSGADALERMAQVVVDLAERINKGSVASQALERSAENWRRCGRLLRGETVEE